jgi:hypothetical protein
MRNYQPTYDTKETAQNIRFFIEANQGLLWTIVKPILPYILALYALDVLINVLYFAESKYEFGLGGIIASYFLTVIAISWHRVVLMGPDHFTPMDPFHPKRHELAFIGMGLLIGVMVFFSTLFIVVVTSLIHKGLVALGVLIAIFFAVFLAYKFSFYFPAKAVGAHVTLKQSFALTRGYFWNMTIASLRASLKPLLQLFGYAFILFLIVTAFLYMIGNETGKGAEVDILVFLLSIPMFVYFQPLLTAIGVTSLSNYYMHALQNRNDSVL